MAIEVACLCGQRFRAKDELAGKRVACTKCGQPIEVPTAAAAGATIVVTCACGGKFSARESLRGRQVACPKCSQPLTIGQPSQSAGGAAADGLGKSLWDELPSAATTLSPAAIAMRSTVANAAASLNAPTGPEPVTAGTKRPAWEFGIGLVLCLGMSIVGVCLLGVSIVKITSAMATGGWQQTTATIMQSDVVVERAGRRRRHKAIVRYEYVVGENRYSGSRVNFGDEGSLIDGRWIASKYKVGTKHTAWFNPQRPSEVVLEKGISLSNMSWLFVSLVVLLGSAGGACFCGLWMWRRMKSGS